MIGKSFKAWQQFLRWCEDGKSAIYSTPYGDIGSPEYIERVKQQGIKIGIEKAVEKAKEIQKGYDCSEYGAEEGWLVLDSLISSLTSDESLKK